MAEYEKDGRQFSKRHVVTYKDGEEPEVEWLKGEKGIPEPDFTRSPQDIRKALEMFRAHAVSVLETHGLPGSPLVYYCSGGGGSWRPAWEIVTTGGRLPPRGGIRTMEEHVKVLGHERDSAPDLAARVLGGLYAMDQAVTHEEVVSAALWLGFDVAFAGAYQTESRENAKKGKAPKNEWAHILAAYYKEKNIKREHIKEGKGIYDRLKKDKRVRVGEWFFSAGVDKNGKDAFKAKKAGDKGHHTVTINTFYKTYWVGTKQKT